MSETGALDIFKTIMDAGKGGAERAATAVAPPEPLVVTSLATTAKAERPNFPPPASIPTQYGSEGIRFDFNQGIRVLVPEGKWRVRLTDMDAGVVIFDGEGESCLFQSRKQHFLNAKIEAFKDGKMIFEHSYDARNQKVAVILPGGTVGDTIAWFPYAAHFARKHSCDVSVMLSPHMKELLEPSYKEIRFLVQNEFDNFASEFYATYYIGLFFGDEDNSWQPADFRMVGLHKTAAYILGVPPVEEPPKLLIDDERPIAEPYVVIACQASTQCKYWNNPLGWLEVVDYLKGIGYRVICIDKDPVYGQGMHWNHIPHGVEDETGQRPLIERARWLKHAEFFVGLSSGLSWLAWAAEIPVVLISGFTHPLNEFFTPYRVFSTHVCNSCWHDIRYPFVHNDFLFCPRHAGTDRQFECTRSITSRHVIDMVDSLVLRSAMRSSDV